MNPDVIYEHLMNPSAIVSTKSVSVEKTDDSGRVKKRRTRKPASLLEDQEESDDKRDYKRCWYLEKRNQELQEENRELRQLLSRGKSADDNQFAFDILPDLEQRISSSFFVKTIGRRRINNALNLYHEIKIGAGHIIKGRHLKLSQENIAESQENFQIAIQDIANVITIKNQTEALAAECQLYKNGVYQT